MRYCTSSAMVMADTTLILNICPQVGEPCNESVVIRLWKLRPACLHVSQDCVQCRLKQSLSFWKDILQASPPILESIENGCCLPYPLLIHKPITSQQSHIMVDEAIQNHLYNKDGPKTIALQTLISSGKLLKQVASCTEPMVPNQFLYALHFKYVHHLIF